MGKKIMAAEHICIDITPCLPPNTATARSATCWRRRWRALTGSYSMLRSGETTLEEQAVYADSLGAPVLPDSGRQEYLESVVNNVMFG